MNWFSIMLVAIVSVMLGAQLSFMLEMGAPVALVDLGMLLWLVALFPLIYFSDPKRLLFF